jgi:hypothetical protein
MLRRISVAYLWLALLTFPLFAVIREKAGLAGVVGIGLAHLALLATAIGAWGAAEEKPEAATHRLLRLASLLLMMGAAVVWIGAGIHPGTAAFSRGAAAYPGADFLNFPAPRADWRFNTAALAAGALLTLAGFAVLTARLWKARERLYSSVGLAMFFLAAGVWLADCGSRWLLFEPTAEEWRSVGEFGLVLPPWLEIGRYGFFRILHLAYMTLAYLAIAAYGVALAKTAWVGKTWGRAFAALGFAGVFLKVSFLNISLFVNFLPYLMGLLLLRRGTGGPPEPVSSASPAEDSAA